MYVCFPSEEIEWKSKSKRHGLKLNVLHFGSAMAGWYIVMTMTGRLYQRSTLFVQQSKNESKIVCSDVEEHLLGVGKIS